MSKSKSRACLAAVAVLMVVGAVATMSTGCDSSLPRWPWWTAEDSTAVRSELTSWRGYLNAASILAGTIDSDSGWNARLVQADSSSETGDTLYKFGHVLTLSFAATDSGHTDVFEFGPSVDTLEMSDTFCFVSYYDSMENCQARISFDSLWVVGYTPDTQIVGSPPETLISYELSYAELRGYDSPQSAGKNYAWKAFRGLHLPKDGADYSLSRTTGFEVTLPDAEEAPDVRHVILVRPGQTDTVFDRPTSDVRGLMNLHSLDTLYRFEQGSEVHVIVELRTTDPVMFFAGTAGNWWDITDGPDLGDGTITMADTGYQHIFVQVLPTASMFYRDADHYGTFWAIPIRVTGP